MSVFFQGFLFEKNAKTLQTLESDARLEISLCSIMGVDKRLASQSKGEKQYSIFVMEELFSYQVLYVKRLVILKKNLDCTS